MIDAKTKHRTDLEYVRRIMEETGLKQQEIADRLDITRVTVGKYYNGQMTMPYTVQVCVEQMRGCGIVPEHDGRYAVNRIARVAPISEA